MKCRIVLIESRLQTRNGLFLLLNTMPHIECLATFPNAASALAALPNVQPDVVLTALDLPDVPDATEYIRQLSSESASILLLANSEPDELLAECIESGAMGCVYKGASPLTLQEMMLNLASARAEISAPIARLLLHNLLHLPRKRGEIFAITHDADLHCVRLFAYGYTDTDLAEQLALTPNDVKSRIFRLLQHIHALQRDFREKFQEESKRESILPIISSPLYRERAA